MQNAIIFIVFLLCAFISSTYLKSQEKDVLTALRSGEKVLWCYSGSEYKQYDKSEVTGVNLMDSIWFTVEGEKKDCDIK